MKALYKLDQLTARQLVQHRLVCLGYATFADLEMSQGAKTDVGYTGFVDTTQNYTDPSTFDIMTLGSGLPLGEEFAQAQGPVQRAASNYAIGSPSDPAMFAKATPDFINESGFTTYSDQVALSGYTDPGFYQQGTTPTANASIPDRIITDAFGALSKFGSVIGSLFGNHPEVIAPTGPNTRTQGDAAVEPLATGTNTFILVVVVATLWFLLMRTPTRGD